QLIGSEKIEKHEGWPPPALLAGCVGYGRRHLVAHVVLTKSRAAAGGRLRLRPGGCPGAGKDKEGSRGTRGQHGRATGPGPNRCRPMGCSEGSARSRADRP